MTPFPVPEEVEAIVAKLPTAYREPLRLFLANASASFEGAVRQEVERRFGGGCPYPLHMDMESYGRPTHRRYLGEATEGVHVIECEACGNVTLERPVAIG